MIYTFSQSSLDNMIGIDQKLKDIAKHALSITWIDFGIPSDGGFRTTSLQQSLYEQKLSKCDGIEKLSKHQTGEALDFFAYVDGKATWDKIYLTIVAASLLEAAKRFNYSIEWGGFWKSFPDFGHIQLA